jgi:hypothetical protein
MAPGEPKENSTMTLSETALRYLQDQNLENFLELRRQIVASPNYMPYAQAEEKVQGLLQQAKYQEAVDALTTMMPGCFLSPGVHLLLAHAHRKLGAEEEAGTETALAEAALHGILQTGDGSQAHPYHVLHVSDEYDVLKYLGKKPAGQTQVEKDGRQFDQLKCEDGTRLWFDISLFFTRPPAG